MNNAPQLTKVNEICSMDAVSLSRAIRERRVSCREVMTAFLDRIDLLNRDYNAIVSLQDREGILRQADERDRQLAHGEYLGWMHGFPQAPKDLALTAGITTTLGSPILKDNIPVEDAIIVERVKRSGAIIIGKTNTSEFGLGSHTYNNVFGTTVNAFDRTKTAGGSSGGAAVALALHMLPVADGSDMMGSLRNPAAYNAVYGFRPSFGRVPYGPSYEIFYQQLATEGPMARNVRDLAMLLSVQAGYDARVPLSMREDPTVFAQPLERDFRGVHVAWLGDWSGYLPMEPGVVDLCLRAVKTLEDIGCNVEEAIPPFPPEQLWWSWLTLRGFLFAGFAEPFFRHPQWRAMMKPEAVWEVENGIKLTGADVYKASVARTSWYLALGEMFRRYELLVLPSAQVFPFAADIPWPQEIAGRTMDTYHRWMEVVIGPSLAGLPTISVPAGFNGDGLPMGVQIAGKPGSDLAVLQLAHAYDQAADSVRPGR